MYVDCDSCTVGFGTDAKFLGSPITFPRDKLPVFAMIGVPQPKAQLSMFYKGSGG